MDEKTIDIENSEKSLDKESVNDERFLSQWTKRLLALGVESRGIRPVPPEERTDTQLFKLFFIWFSVNCNALAFSSGTIGPVVYGLGLRDSCLTILFFDLLCFAPPAYFSTWGPKLGMRQMIMSRYSFGYYGVIVTCILNLAGMCGFGTLNSILGGQALSSAADGKLSWTVGIVIIDVIALLVSFCGMRYLLWYERVSWIPAFITFLIALGVGGKSLSSPQPDSPATIPAILGFASTLAGFAITFSPLSSDFTIYFDSKSSGWKVFLYAYLGFLLPTVLLQVSGAAVAIATPQVPAWADAYQGGNVGGLIAAMLQPTKGFGKVLIALLSLSTTGNIAATLYSVGINLQVFAPFLVAVPRYVFSIVATAIVISLAVVGAHRFYDTLNNFLGVIGYWAAAYVGILLVEHLLFRRNNAELYNVQFWDKPRKLPSGIAALAAGIASFGLVVPCIGQVWYTGPIAKITGDIGFEVAFAVSTLLYIPFRAIEIRLRGSL
ncbi:hypothetical protein M378DRAFT_434337 [Amanita muscaria Koide BX008]|uniref:Cytosine-purine permease n=1 Tax=Amanita muscaria (strain Koide BX008) TaxID=946122 RepID=A0A0C2SSD5_AMAMK|nr:hypothetical protein M378DRAFT_434337 [Amanita muscaria Koide BX008]